MQLLKAKIQKDQKGMILDLADDLIMGGNKKEKGSTFSPIPHDDLIAEFQKLKPALIKTIKADWPYNKLQPSLFTTTEQHEANKVLAQIISDGYDEVEASIEVTGFSLSGEESNRAVKVTGTIEKEGQKVGFSSLRIVFTHDSLGIEEALEKQVKKCIDQVHQYLGGKHGEAKGDPNQLKLPLNSGMEEVELSQEELQKRRDEAIENKENGVIDTPHGKVKKKRSSTLKRA